MGYKSAAFYRKMEGYTNGYWSPGSQEFVSNAVYSYPTWYRGSAQEFSYIDGTTDRTDIKNVFNLYTYVFVRLGLEPERVEEYIPDYWNTEYETEYLDQPTAPVKGKYLNKIDHLPVPAEEVKPDPVPEPPVPPVEPEPPVEPKPTPEVTLTEAEEPEKPEIIPLVITTKEEIKEEEIPLSDPEELLQETEIVEEEVPLSRAQGTWALINLILTVLTILASLVMKIFLIIYKIHDSNDDDDEENEEDKIEYNNHPIRRLIHCAIAIVMAIIFVLTEDMTLKMVLVDKWTLLMAIIFLIQFILMIFCARQKKDNEEQDGVEN